MTPRFFHWAVRFLGEDYLVQLVTSLNTRYAPTLDVIVPREGSGLCLGGVSIHDHRGPVIQPVVTGPAAKGSVDLFDACIERNAGAEVDYEPLTVQDHHAEIFGVNSIVGLSSSHG